MPSFATRRTISRTFLKILALLHLTPRSAHAEARCAFAARARREFRDLLNREQSATRKLP